MKRFVWRVLLLGLLACLVLSTACPVFAQDKPSTSYESTAAWVTALADTILSARLEADGADSLQAWADTVLPGMIGMGGEWYALALHQRDASLDLSAYSRALQKFLRDRAPDADNAVTKQRYALALLASGGGDTYLARVAGESAGDMGHMSYVYGLHLAQNGWVGALSAENMLEYLLQAQLPDGGWSVLGESAKTSDVDVTAMTLQALAYYAQDERVIAAAERAWSFLSAAQTADGDYYSYGVQCPESGAQVIVALCSWGYDITDERFVRDGVTLLDGLMRYQLDNGCFSHTLNGTENVMATVQCLYAMVAIERAARGEGTLYQIERPSGVEDLTAVQENDGTVVLSDLPLKAWISLGIAALALLACFILFMQGKRGVKQYASIAILAALALGAVLLIDIQSAEDYYQADVPIKEHPTGSVTLTIRCDTVLGKDGTAHLPQDGVMLPVTTFVIEDGETVFDILSQAAAAYGLRVQNTGVTANSSALAYISGINDLHEFDFGDLSGWVYRVNGERPSVGCGEYKLHDGDVIEFLYSCELGEDIE